MKIELDSQFRNCDECGEQISKSYKITLGGHYINILCEKCLDILKMNIQEFEREN